MNVPVGFTSSSLGAKPNSITKGEPMFYLALVILSSLGTMTLSWAAVFYLTRDLVIEVADHDSLVLDAVKGKDYWEVR